MLAAIVAAPAFLAYKSYKELIGTTSRDEPTAKEKNLGRDRSWSPGNGNDQPPSVEPDFVDQR